MQAINLIVVVFFSARLVCTQHPTERMCEANAAGEIAHSFFTVCVKSFPLCHFKLAYVILYMAVKEFFETHF